MDDRKRSTGQVKHLVWLLMIGVFALALIPAAIFAAQEGEAGRSLGSAQARTGAPLGLSPSLDHDPAGDIPEAGQAASEQSVSAVKAVVLRTFSSCSSENRPWDTLNTNWSSYGSTPLSIVYDDPELCAGTITYADLVASGADVLIMDWSIGQYSADEKAAIKSYAEAGHNLFATYQTFQGSGFDNRDLAPLFGLQSVTEFTTTLQYADYVMVNTGDPMFEGMTDSYASDGYFSLFYPEVAGEWTSTALDGARFVARSLDQKAAITLYAGKGYYAIYVSNPVEYTLGYGPGNQDVQFIYNALTYPAIRKAVVVRSGGCYGYSGLVLLDANWPDYGTTPVFVEFGNDQLCSEVTLTGLEASGADVVIVSFANGPDFTNDELIALEQYANEGHNLIATYLSFGDYLNYDNRNLAALFGLRSDQEYAYASLRSTPVVTQTISSTLFTDLPDSFSTSTLVYSQTPPDITWDDDDLAGAVYAAISDDKTAAVTWYQAAHYDSFYISGMPEISYQPDSSQLLYNAITFGSHGFDVYLPAVLKSP